MELADEEFTALRDQAEHIVSGYKQRMSHDGGNSRQSGFPAQIHGTEVGAAVNLWRTGRHGTLSATDQPLSCHWLADFAAHPANRRNYDDC